MAVITYLDRLCISAAMPSITADFNLSLTQKGMVFSAFTLAYAAFEIPGGWLGDRYGARLALTRVVMWWSAFTALTGAAIGYRSLLVIRFLFGAGEAGAFPNIAKAVSRWFPTSEQGRALSASFVGLSVGSAMTAPIVLTLLDHQSWRWTFVEFGVIGSLWCLVWNRWFRDLPENHPSVNQAELKLIRSDSAQTAMDHSHSIPWMTLLKSKNLIFIGLMYFAYAYGLYFYITWLPTYLLEARGFSVNSTKLFASLPWIVSALANGAGGWLTDRIARTGSLKWARCGVGAIGYSGSAVVLIAVAQVKNNLAAALLLALAFGLQTMTVSAAWSVCLDVGRRYAGVVTGFMNFVGNLGGTVAPLVFGYVVKHFGSWSLPFYIMAGVFILGVPMWLLIDPHRLVMKEET
ncbi:MAG: MFS transporter [Acidobacteria bacterium]|nr:MFS transporter [Acidobacteriota bacterium]